MIFPGVKVLDIHHNILTLSKLLKSEIATCDDPMALHSQQGGPGLRNLVKQLKNEVE